MKTMYKLMKAFQNASKISDTPLEIIKGEDRTIVVSSKHLPGFKAVDISEFGNDIDSWILKASRNECIYFRPDGNFILSVKGLYYKRHLIVCIIQFVIFSVLVPCAIAYLTTRCSVL